MEKITFYPDGENREAVDFYVLEETMIGGVTYILVTDTEDEDGDALILKDLSQDGEEEALYAIVEERTDIPVFIGVLNEVGQE